MKEKDSVMIVCNLKELRQKKGLTQSQLADMLDIKRQAVYDIESGRYLPNTLLALRLARIMGVTVEDIFEEKYGSGKKIEMADEISTDGRINIAKVRGKLIGYPMTGKNNISQGFQPADGIYLGGGDVQLFKHESVIDNTVVLLGCDPAFNILSSHVSGTSDTFMHYRFASSRKALECLAAGQAHVAGTHLQNTGNSEANIEFARQILRDQTVAIVAFAEFEEGILVAPGNPRGIKGIDDLTASGLRFINREEGAALRMLLDDYLKEKNIPAESISGYDKCVYSHSEGAQMIRFGLADAALGLRAIADIYELGFVPLSAVRCDLVIPADLMDIRAVHVLMDVLQTKRLRVELQALSGYDTSNTGKIILEP
jgi:molybdate-binding protein/DNA-binding XRE family transcriptional regulator